jgi:hypothetical protein
MYQRQFEWNDMFADDTFEEALVPSYDHYACIDNLEYLEYLNDRRERKDR